MKSKIKKDKCWICDEPVEYMLNCPYDWDGSFVCEACMDDPDNCVSESEIFARATRFGKEHNKPENFLNRNMI